LEKCPEEAAVLSELAGRSPRGSLEGKGASDGTKRHRHIPDRPEGSARGVAARAGFPLVIPRIVTSLLFFAVLLFGLFSSWPGARYVILVMVGAATWVGTHEYYNLARRLKVRPSPWPGHSIALAFLVDAYFFGFGHFVHLFIACFWLLLFTQVFFKKIDRAVVNMACSIFGSVYVGLPMAILLFLFKHAEDWGFAPPQAPAYAGGNLVIFLITTSWATDIGGYCFGRPLGRHKLAPALSPNKSIEGLAGGVALAVLAGLLLRLFWPGLDAMIGWGEAIALPVLFSVLGTVGDLAESAFKRDAGVKDSGRTYTGHGGMLDIIDSILLCAPVFYLYLEMTRG